MMVVSNDISYQYKYTDRDKINLLMEMRGDCDDILIIKNGLVTDSSVANVIFRTHGGNWITPVSYLLRGTRRENLLKSGLIEEYPVSFSDINRYTEVRLVNAMTGINDSEGISVRNIVLSRQP